MNIVQSYSILQKERERKNKVLGAGFESGMGWAGEEGGGEA